MHYYLQIDVNIRNETQLQSTALYVTVSVECACKNKKIKSINVFILDCIIQCKCNLDPYKLSLFDRKWLVC